jgi:hypothetical protein
MTDRLKSLLHAEVETIEIPPAPTGEILGAGRRLRRRRTGTIWGAAALTVAVVAGGAAVARTGGDGSADAPVTGTPAAPSPGTLAYSLDDMVYVVEDGRLTTGVQMPEVAQTLYYTSAGILVRTNKDGSSDGGAPFHFRLVQPDGTVSPVNVTLGDVVPSTDPSQPYLAYATQAGGRVQVVVHDVVSGHDLATVDVPGAFTWGGWEAPPVALSGDQVYVGTDAHTTVVNWRTGEATTTDSLPDEQLPEVSGGRTLTVPAPGSTSGSQATEQVVDVTSGKVLLEIPVGRFDQVSLSPDGRFAMVVREAIGPPVRVTVYDVDSAASVRLPDSVSGYSWTSGGDLFSVQGDRLDLCSPTSGTCETTTIPKLGLREFVRYSGQTYES